MRVRSGHVVVSIATAFVVIGAASPGAAEVLVEGFAFRPASVRVPVGATVSWTIGTDAEQHTVTPQGHSAWDDSGYLFPGDVFEVTFDEPGTYAYLCTLHPTMTGTIAVAPAPESSTPAQPPPTRRPEPGTATPAQPTATAPARMTTAAATTEAPRPNAAPDAAAATSALPLVPVAVVVVVAGLVLGSVVALRRRA